MAAGRQRLGEDPFTAFDGVLAYDGRIGTDGGKPDTAFGAFFEGVAAHAQGAKAWDAALDESK